MRRMGTTIASVLFLGLLLLVPATVLAAPAITIAPAAVPRGGEVTVTGTGFAPSAALTAVLDVGGGRRSPVTDLTAGADGSIRFTFKVPTSAPPGETVTLLILSRPDGATLAQGTLSTTSAPPVSSEQIAIAPASGPAGTRFEATGTGFKPGLNLQLVVVPSATGAQTPPERQVALGSHQVGADGRFTVAIDSTGFPPEPYDLVALTGNPGPPYVGRFTVTAGAMPGLPNTGGGGASFSLTLGWLVLGIVALTGVGRWAWRERRRMPRP